MNCVINNSILDNIQKGKKVEVIRQYILKKYHINMDMESLKERIKALNLKLDY